MGELVTGRVSKLCYFHFENRVVWIRPFTFLRGSYYTAHVVSWNSIWRIWWVSCIQNVYSSKSGITLNVLTYLRWDKINRDCILLWVTVYIQTGAVHITSTAVERTVKSDHSEPIDYIYSKWRIARRIHEIWIILTLMTLVFGMYFSMSLYLASITVPIASLDCGIYKTVIIIKINS